MIEAAATFGLIIFIGMMFLILKLPRGVVLWLLGHSLVVDLTVTIFAIAIHWGTMTGLMAAAIAGMCCSVATWLGKKLIGYKINGRIYRGVLT
jgi:hypothetical protein